MHNIKQNVLKLGQYGLAIVLRLLHARWCKVCLAAMFKDPSWQLYTIRGSSSPNKLSLSLLLVAGLPDSHTLWRTQFQSFLTDPFDYRECWQHETKGITELFSTGTKALAHHILRAAIKKWNSQHTLKGLQWELLFKITFLLSDLMVWTQLSSSQGL